MPTCERNRVDINLERIPRPVQRLSLAYSSRSHGISILPKIETQNEIYSKNIPAQINKIFVGWGIYFPHPFFRLHTRKLFYENEIRFRRNFRWQFRRRLINRWHRTINYREIFRRNAIFAFVIFVNGKPVSMIIDVIFVQ